MKYVTINMTPEVESIFNTPDYTVSGAGADIPNCITLVKNM